MSIRLPRPTGIRNGGLLLVLVALAAVMGLVDRPPEPGGGELGWAGRGRDRGRGTGGSGTITRPPVTPPAVGQAPVARVRVPSSEVRVTLAVLGRDLARGAGQDARGGRRGADGRGGPAPAALTARP